MSLSTSASLQCVRVAAYLGRYDISLMSLPGVAIGMIFLFVMIMGEFATAVVVYGGKTSTAGTVILNYYGIANYPFAAVNALMLMVAMVIGIIIILRLVDIRKEL